MFIERGDVREPTCAFAEFVLANMSRTSEYIPTFARIRCSGTHVRPVSSLFINTALLLWAFDIHEDPIEPIDTMGFTDGSNVRPHPFKVTFAPRIEKLRSIVDSQSA